MSPDITKYLLGDNITPSSKLLLYVSHFSRHCGYRNEQDFKTMQLHTL